MAKREYTWYIEPLDVDTNQTVSQELSIENFCPTIRCEDGKKHNLWTCSNQLAISFVKSKESLNLHFNIWGKEGRHGKIRDKTFLFSKKWRKTQRAKKQKAKTVN